jgi:folate-dependent tRNA-U54 methylase TrmFO/GidA
MNANYGLMPDLKIRARGREKKIEMGTRALEAIDQWILREQIQPPTSMAPCEVRL